MSEQSSEKSIGIAAYTMTHDDGFAPNPFWGVLTLATCKTSLRRNIKKINAKFSEFWIAGFCGTTLQDITNHTCSCADVFSQNSTYLIYLAKVSDIVSQCSYYGNIDYKLKIPIPKDKSKLLIEIDGDNIYKPNKENCLCDTHDPKDFTVVENCYHKTDETKQQDLSGMNVIISREYYYFGRKAISVPVSMGIHVAKRNYCYRGNTREVAADLINYVKSQAHGKIGVHGPPHRWPSTDDSWKVTSSSG